MSQNGEVGRDNNTPIHSEKWAKNGRNRCSMGRNEEGWISREGRVHQPKSEINKGSSKSGDAMYPGEFERQLKNIKRGCQDEKLRGICFEERKSTEK